MEKKIKILGCEAKIDDDDFMLSVTVSIDGVIKIFYVINRWRGSRIRRDETPIFLIKVDSRCQLSFEVCNNGCCARIGGRVVSLDILSDCKDIVLGDVNSVVGDNCFDKEISEAVAMVPTGTDPYSCGVCDD